MLMPDVYDLYSSEWQALFDRLEAAGYEVTYADGALHFQSPEVSLTVTPIRGRWHIEGTYLVCKPRYDWQAIKAILDYLGLAKQSRRDTLREKAKAKRRHLPGGRR